jgi:hypothetical protein
MRSGEDNSDKSEDYKPTAAAAFSRNSEPSRMYRRNIAVFLCPVCNRLIGVPSSDQAQDFQLTFAEWLDQCRGLRAERVD